MTQNEETVVLAGGCYWIMQQLLRSCDGVLSTRVGWIGGESEHPTEDNPGGHAEAVEVTFDPERVSCRELLEYFFVIHRADFDERVVGSSYRSEIFCTGAEQRTIAAETIMDVDASGHWPGRIATKVSEAGVFWEAEAEDQDHLHGYPHGCRRPFLPADRDPAHAEALKAVGLEE